MKLKILLSLSLCLSSSCFAGYNANYRSEITGVYVYSGGDSIYVTLKNKPATECENTYFVVKSSVPEGRRQMLLSRLLLAFTTKENVNIGYDKEAGDCADGRYVTIHRVG